LDQLLATADPTTGVEKVPNYFAEGEACSAPFFIAPPSSEAKKSFRRKQKLHICEMSRFRLYIAVCQAKILYDSPVKTSISPDIPLEEVVSDST